MSLIHSSLVSTLVISATLLVALSCGDEGSSETSDSSESAAKTSAEPGSTTGDTAKLDSILNLIETNMPQAETEYKDKEVSITGKVTYINYGTTGGSTNTGQLGATQRNVAGKMDGGVIPSVFVVLGSADAEEGEGAGAYCHLSDEDKVDDITIGQYLEVTGLATTIKKAAGMARTGTGDLVNVDFPKITLKKCKIK